MPDAAPPTPPRPAGLDRPLALLMSVAAGLAVANIYYNQPMLGQMAAEFAARDVSAVPTATQLGYALGLVLLVPLGDRIDRRRLILWQGAGLVASLGLAALAPGLVGLAAASVAIGVFSTIAQQLIPLAAELARPEARGQAVGTLMSGLLAGILLARTVSGLVAEHAGWRAMFWLGAGLAVLMLAALASRLPRSRPGSRDRYGTLLRSLLHLARTQPALRRAALTQGLLFAGFSAFWTTLAILLEGPRFRLGADVAGLFGLLALGGVFIAPVAGRLADRRGPAGVVRLGVALVALAFLGMAVSVTLPALAIGVVVLDAGLQMAMVSHQAVIFGLAGEARGRFNTVFMTSLFAFGAIGSAVASPAWHAGGWRAVMGFGAAAAVLALVVQRGGRVQA